MTLEKLVRNRLRHPRGVAFKAWGSKLKLWRPAPANKPINERRTCRFRWGWDVDPRLLCDTDLHMDRHISSNSTTAITIDSFKYIHGCFHPVIKIQRLRSWLKMWENLTPAAVSGLVQLFSGLHPTYVMRTAQKSVSIDGIWRSKDDRVVLVCCIRPVSGSRGLDTDMWNLQLRCCCSIQLAIVLCTFSFGWIELRKWESNMIVLTADLVMICMSGFGGGGDVDVEILLWGVVWISSTKEV